jgi:hypothetical protein
VKTSNAIYTVIINNAYETSLVSRVLSIELLLVTTGFGVTCTVYLTKLNKHV